MNDEEWEKEMHMIVDYAYGEDWTERHVHLREGGTEVSFGYMWEARYNDVAKGANAVTAWLLENEPEVWHTLKPLIIEWTKYLVWGPDWMYEEEVDEDGMETGFSVAQAYEEYKKQRAGCDA